MNGRWNDNRATDVCNGDREESAVIWSAGVAAAL